MKPEVGMFYRYKGQIGKYKKITELDRYPSFTNNYLRKNEVILLNNAKFSYNIIDILERGDYVSTITGECAVIAGVYNDINSKKYLRLCNCIGEYYEDDIKSIVTHEQMEQMAYKVGE